MVVVLLVREKDSSDSMHPDLHIDYDRLRVVHFDRDNGLCHNHAQHTQGRHQVAVDGRNGGRRQLSAARNSLHTPAPPQMCPGRVVS